LREREEGFCCCLDGERTKRRKKCAAIRRKSPSSDNVDLGLSKAKRRISLIRIDGVTYGQRLTMPYLGGGA